MRIVEFALDAERRRCERPPGRKWRAVTETPSLWPRLRVGCQCAGSMVLVARSVGVSASSGAAWNSATLRFAQRMSQMLTRPDLSEMARVWPEGASGRNVTWRRASVWGCGVDFGDLALGFDVKDAGVHVAAAGGQARVVWGKAEVVDGDLVGLKGRGEFLVRGEGGRCAEEADVAVFVADCGYWGHYLVSLC